MGAHIIPTKKEELYSYPIEWDIFRTLKLGNLKLKPWISKQVTEYFGQLEEELVTYIMSMVKEEKSPEEIERELEPVFGLEDAAKMVYKMWQKIIQLINQNC